MRRIQNISFVVFLLGIALVSSFWLGKEIPEFEFKIQRFPSEILVQQADLAPPISFETKSKADLFVPVEAIPRTLVPSVDTESITNQLLQQRFNFLVFNKNAAYAFYLSMLSDIT